MKRVAVLNTIRFIDPEDINQNGIEKLNEILARREYVVYKENKKDMAYGFIDMQLGDYCTIKFAYDILGKLYTDDPWNSVREFRCNPNSIRKLTEDEF